MKFFFVKMIGLMTLFDALIENHIRYEEILPENQLHRVFLVLFEQFQFFLVDVAVECRPTVPSGLCSLPSSSEP
jgi:hypothetical protein